MNFRPARRVELAGSNPATAPRARFLSFAANVAETKPLSGSGGDMGAISLNQCPVLECMGGSDVALTLELAQTVVIGRFNKYIITPTCLQNPIQRSWTQ